MLKACMVWHFVWNAFAQSEASLPGSTQESHQHEPVLVPSELQSSAHAMPSGHLPSTSLFQMPLCIAVSARLWLYPRPCFAV